MQSWNLSRHRRPALQREEPKRHGFIRLIVWVIILSAAGYFIYNSSVLKVNDIKISGIDDAYASEVYTQVLNSVKDESIYSIKEGYITDLINEKYPNLKLNEITYSFPNNFEINLSKRDETYNVQATNGVFKLDSEGFVLGETDESTSSMELDVIYDKTLEVGKKIEDASLQAGLIYSDLNQRIKIENDQVEFNLDNGGKVILPQNTAISRVNNFYNILQKIIQKYSIDNRQIEFIDLRFEKPVIKYSN